MDESKHQIARDDAIGANVQDGASLIAAERERQIEAEGWTHEHDDSHAWGELALAAACYALPERITRGPALTRRFYVHRFWPWEVRFWRPTGDRVRELTKAGALIAAEIDRLQRRGQTKEGSGHANV